MNQNENRFIKFFEKDSDDVIMSPCFEISPDVELKDVPTSGEEYLLKVMNERKNCAAVIRSDRDYSKYSKNQSRFVEEEPQTAAPEKLKPTIEWQNIQVADFSELRLYLARMRLKPPTDIQLTKRESIENWQCFFDKEEPTLLCMFGLHSDFLHHGLNFLLEKLDEVKPGDSINKRTGLWIYAFLACLSQPLLSDTTSVLRSIARKCAIIR